MSLTAPQGNRVTPATRFQAASVSKPATARGVLPLVEQGRIGLDQRVIGHLRRWRLPPSPFDPGGITVRRLLSHTAGLSVHGYAGQTPKRPLPPIEASLSGEAGGSFPAELLETPGRRSLYSGSGYSVLQLLVEEFTGWPITRVPIEAGGPAWRCCSTDGSASWCWPTATPAAAPSTPWSSSG